MTTAISESSLAQSKKPELAQYEMERIREAAAVTRNIRGMAPYLPRKLSRALLQLLFACDSIYEVIQGELGEDAAGHPIGNLTLRESPTLPAAHQPKLDDGATNI